MPIVGLILGLALYTSDFGEGERKCISLIPASRIRWLEGERGSDRSKRVDMRGLLKEKGIHGHVSLGRD